MKYKSNGKILLTSEYLVLDGALALALPSKLSQNLEVKYTDNKKVIYVNKDKQTLLWTVYHTILALELGAIVIIEGIELLTR